jgi:hypothetical protein
MYSVEKEIDPQGPRVICPHCGYGHPFQRLPLFLLSGASCTGKSTVCLELVSRLPECVCLETDILWGAVNATPDDGYRSYRDMWLRVAKNIGQAGRPVLLCGSAVPEQFESCPERRYFSDIQMMALVCEAAELVRRLRARPGWRKSGDGSFVQAMVDFNRWFGANAAQSRPPIALLDTTHLSISETADRVAAWTRARLPRQIAEAACPVGEDLGGQVDHLRTEAKEIITRLGLLDLLSQHGQAEIVGSVALGLVVKRDIDLHLLVSTTDDILAVTDRLYHVLLGRDDIAEVRISDYRSEGGLKIGIDAYAGPSGNWSIDLWVTDRLEATAFAETAYLRQALTPEHRRAILELKRHYHACGELHHGLSTRIYHAVLDADVRTVEEFERYRARTSAG